MNVIESEKSRCINEARLEVQQKRSDLLSTLKDSTKERLAVRLRDPNVRKGALRKLIVQVEGVDEGFGEVTGEEDLHTVQARRRGIDKRHS